MPPAIGVDLDGPLLDHASAAQSALPFLGAVRGAGMRVGVLTNGDREQQVRKMAVTGLLGWVDLVLASSEMPAGKLDPRACTALCEALDSSPQDTAHVGDDLAADVRGAAAAGLRPVWLCRDGSPGAPSDGARWQPAATLWEAASLLGVPMDPSVQEAVPGLNRLWVARPASVVHRSALPGSALRRGESGFTRASDDPVGAPQHAVHA